MTAKGHSAASAGTASQDRWLRRLAAHCWRYPGLVLMALGGTLLATVVTAVIPLIQRNIIDNSILTRTQPIWPGAVLLIIAALLNFAGVYVRRYRGGRLSLDVQHGLRTELFGSLSRLDGARQDQLHTGQIVSRSISDLNMVQGLLSMVPMLLGNVVLFVLSLIVMAFLSPLLTVVALAVGPALWLIAIRSQDPAVPGELGRPAAGRRTRGSGRRRGHRRARGQGLRPGRAGNRRLEGAADGCSHLGFARCG